MINIHSTARFVARNSNLGMSAKRLEEVMRVIFKYWYDGLADGDEVDIPTIGHIIPMRWALGPQHSLYRTRMGRTPLNRNFTWRLKLDGDVNLKAALRKTMSK